MRFTTTHLHRNSTHIHTLCKTTLQDYYSLIMARTRCAAQKDLEDSACDRRTNVIDLNIPDPGPQEEEDNENNKYVDDESPNNQAAGGSSSHMIDWNRGSIDIADDGRLEYVNREPAPSPEGPDYASAVYEAQAAEDARRTRIPDSSDEQDVDVDDDDDDDDDGGDVGGYSLWSF